MPVRFQTQPENLDTTGRIYHVHDNLDLDEYTLILDCHFDGALENFKISVDFTVLNYENDQKDATDLRSSLIYSF